MFGTVFGISKYDVTNFQDTTKPIEAQRPPGHNTQPNTQIEHIPEQNTSLKHIYDFEAPLPTGYEDICNEDVEALGLDLETHITPDIIKRPDKDGYMIGRWTAAMQKHPDPGPEFDPDGRRRTWSERYRVSDDACEFHYNQRRYAEEEVKFSKMGEYLYKPRKYVHKINVIVIIAI